MPTFDLVARIKAVDQASSVFRSVADNASRLSRGFSQLGQIANIAGGFIVASIGLNAASAVRSFLTEAVNTVIEMKSLSGVLKKAIENMGLSWSEWGPKITKQIDEIRASTLYTKQELLEALTILVRYGLEPEEALRALSVAIDVAAGSGRSLKQVAEDLGQAFLGQASDLKSKYGVEVEKTSERLLSLKERVESLEQRYGRLVLVSDDVVEALAKMGITIDETSRQTLSWGEVVEKIKGRLDALEASTVEEFLERYGAASSRAEKTTLDFTEILSRLDEKFRGSAYAAYEASGAYARFSNLMEEVKEVVGAGLIPILEALGNTFVMWAKPETREKMLEAMRRDFFSLVDSVSEAAVNIQMINEGLKASLLNSLKTIFDTISSAAINVIGLILNTLTPSLSALAEATSNTFRRIAEVVLSSLESIKQGASEAFRAIMENLFSLSASWAQTVEWIVERSKGILDSINQIQLYLTSLRSVAGEVWSAISASMWRFYTNALIPIQNAVRGFVNSVVAAFNWLWDVLARRSIWPDMWAEMLSQAKSGLTAIERTVEPALLDLAHMFAALSTVNIGSINITTHAISSSIDIRRLAEQVGYEVARQLSLRNRI